MGTLIIFLCIALKRRGQAAVIRVAINGFGRIGRNFLR
ncbi:MAG: type I glyceraldehyde-3-phosphate dehydrogenase, partial [bacterium]